jgi:hypothetical protein
MSKSIVLCLLQAACALSLTGNVVAQESQRAYRFFGPSSRNAVFKIRDKLWLGEIDKYGTFMPERRAGPSVTKRIDPKTKVTEYRIMGPLTNPVNVPQVANSIGLTYNVEHGKIVEIWLDKDHKAVSAPPLTEKVYEYRSGMLIEGHLDRQGNFTPKPGSTILDISDFAYSPAAPRIYNLPGIFVEEKPRSLQKGTTNRSQQQHNPSLHRTHPTLVPRAVCSGEFQRCVAIINIHGGFGRFILHALGLGLSFRQQRSTHARERAGLNRFAGCDRALAPPLP